MKRIRLKSKRKLKISTKFSLIIILILISTLLFLNYANKSFFPILMKQAKIDCKKMAIEIIKNSLTDEILEVLEEDDLFKIIQNSNGDLQTIDYNPVIVNKFLSRTTSVVSENLKNIEKGKIDNISFINSDDYNIKNLKNGVISEIPMGIITNNVLLSNLGPKIPVKLNLVGNVVSSIETNIKNYGINNSILEIFAKVEVTEEVIIPFQTKRIKVQNNIPISIKIIQGSVPEYYNSGYISKNSDILSLPIERD